MAVASNLESSEDQLTNTRIIQHEGSICTMNQTANVEKSHGKTIKVFQSDQYLQFKTWPNLAHNQIIHMLILLLILLFTHQVGGVHRNSESEGIA